ncbi:RHS repeat domain-containing protein [Flavobacterium branchiophilum]|uniref:RHS repeat domain-containing protein n=1 Tax=Flavobacterium branchiophilum TaxID=55197 RepID=UPI00167FE4C0|nr:RHS repeat-associated core domain-containing protein [Flavobacterium branchiophilum]
MGEVSQHSEYFVFGESFVEEHKNSHNSPYKFNGKELDEESGYTYFGARYLDMRYSIWNSTDPLSGYNPVMEDEHYIDGQHNGGVKNEKNLSTYGYCYQSPIMYKDPNGKQIFFVDVPPYLEPLVKVGEDVEMGMVESVVSSSNGARSAVNLSRTSQNISRVSKFSEKTLESFKRGNVKEAENIAKNGESKNYRKFDAVDNKT